MFQVKWSYPGKATLSKDTLSSFRCLCGASWLWHFMGNFTITKTSLYNFDPLKPHFYIVKPGFIGYTLFFLFLLKNIDCGYSLEPPRRGGSNEYPKSMFWAEIWKISEFLSENFQFVFVVKFSMYLNSRLHNAYDLTCQEYISWSAKHNLLEALKEEGVRANYDKTQLHSCNDRHVSKIKELQHRDRLGMDSRNGYWDEEGGG